MSVPAGSRFAFAYGMAFGLLYVVARAHGLALFTVSFARCRAFGNASFP